jgi:hypothetical protein
LFKANLNKVLLGSTIQLNWNCEHLRFNYFLYLKKSHKSSSKDRKLSRIAEKGSVNITVTDRNFEPYNIFKDSMYWSHNWTGWKDDYTLNTINGNLVMKGFNRKENWENSFYYTCDKTQKKF